jgi:hypothetical protein
MITYVCIGCMYVYACFLSLPAVIRAFVSCVCTVCKKMYEYVCIEEGEA